MRFRQHFIPRPGENQEERGIYGIRYSSRSPTSASTLLLRWRSLRFFRRMRQIALPRGREITVSPRERYMGKWVHVACLSLSGGCGFAASGGKMRRATPLEQSRIKSVERPCKRQKGRGAIMRPVPFAVSEGTRRASGGPVRRAVRAPWTCRMARARGDSCDGGLVPAAWLSGLSAVPTTMACETGQRVSPPYALYPFLRRLCRRTVATA